MTRTYRNRPRRDYTIVRNAALRDDRLSLKAKGLLALMLSFPDDWTYHLEYLERLSTDGRDATRGAVRELETLGYVGRRQARAADGTLSSSVYEVVDAPGTVDGFPVDGSTVDGSTVDGEPAATKTDDTKTDDTKTDHLPPLPPDAAIARELEEAEAKARGAQARRHDRAVLATAHPKVWVALAKISSSKKWAGPQLHAVARRVLELTRDHGDEPVVDLLGDVLLNLAEIRSPIAYLERALEKRAARPASSTSSSSSVDLDAIFGGPS